MRFDDIWSVSDKIEGFLAVEEARLLFDFALQIPENGVIVELGSFCGKSSYILANIAKYKRGELYCVDVFIPNFDGIATPPEVAMKSLSEHVLIPFYDHTKLIADFTANAGKWFSGEVDFLFIDADHSYDGVKQDLEEWLPKLKNGGYVAFHDYFNNAFPGVKQAVDEHTVGWHNVKNDFSIAVFRKP